MYVMHAPIINDTTMVRNAFFPPTWFTEIGRIFRGTKRLVSVNISSVEVNSAGTFFSKVSPGIFMIKVK